MNKTETEIIYQGDKVIECETAHFKLLVANIGYSKQYYR